MEGSGIGGGFAPGMTKDKVCVCLVVVYMYFHVCIECVGFCIFTTVVAGYSIKYSFTPHPLKQEKAHLDVKKKVLQTIQTSLCTPG